PTAAGLAPLAATSHVSHPTAARAPVGPAATAAGGMLPQALSVGPQVGTVPAQPAAVMAPAALAGAQAAAVPQIAGTAPVAVPAGAVPAATATGAAVGGMAVPPVSTASRYAASRAYSRRKSKTASLAAIIVLVLAIAALTPLVIKVVFYP
ncbi:MAG: hypothetical protein K6T86_11985, partial [Pirellulales bacterium]|nr:hypothetical protein [Pirellulales bacterium]